MNSYGPSYTQSAYLPNEFILPKDETSFYDFISKRERLTSKLLNVKEIAQYEQIQILTGQQFFDPNAPTEGEPDLKRYTFRLVSDMVAANGANITAGSTVNFAHGIDIIVTPTRIYGTATDTNGNFLPLPYSSTYALNKNIEILCTATNVTLINGAGQNTLKQAYIIFEWTKN